MRSFSFYRNSTFVSLLIGYMGYYLCRQNFSAAYGPMRETLHMDPMLFGSISSFGTLVYAIGKFITGPIADAKRGKTVFLFGLFASVVCSILFGISSTVFLFFVFWALNRLVQSMGWPGIVNVMANWFPSKSYGTAMGVMSISFQFGGVLASLFAGLLLSMGAGWRELFYVPALTLLVMGIISRFFIFDTPEELGFKPVKADPKIHSKELKKGTGLSFAGYWDRFRILLTNRLFLATCLLSFVLTLLRECFNLWMPAYFFDLGAKASTAAFKSAIFPLLGCAGTFVVGWYTDRHFSGRRGFLMGVFLLALSAVLAALGFVKTSTLALPLVGLAGFLLLGPYSLIAGAIALDFGGKEAAGTAAGIFDGVGYLGAALSGVGVAQLVVHSGWPVAFGFMAVLTFLSALLCFFLKEL